jgi:tRNA 2-thiouridine synthesizing protein A
MSSRSAATIIDELPMEEPTMAIEYTRTLDVKGAKCPMPLVKSRKAINDLNVGDVLQVVATDRGSVADFQGWARTAKNIEIVAQETQQENGQDLYVHYLRRTA